MKTNTVNSFEPENMNTQTPEEFLSKFTNTKFRYFADNDKSITKGKSDTRHPEWNNEQNQNGEFFTVNGFTGGQTDEFLDTLNAVFVDVDYEVGISDTERRRRISALYMDMDAMEFTPSYIIETRKGCHCYWILDKPVKKSDLKAGQWEEAKKQYLGILTTLVAHWGADPGAKTIGRVLRVPGSRHWKQADDPFTVGFFGGDGTSYAWQTIAKLFSPQYETKKVAGEFPKAISDALELQYPRLSRPSSQALLRTTGTHIPVGMRNKSLHAISTILRDAGTPLDQALAMFPEYHGIVSERGIQAARNTIRSAYAGKWVYGNTSDVIAPHVTADERTTIAAICKKEYKAKKEADHLRYNMFEHEILAQYPNMRRDSAGTWYMYDGGIYVPKSKDQMQALVMTCLEEAELYDHKTRTKANDKIACLAALIPEGFEPDADENIINVHNGLLEIKTLKLLPHTPEYQSLSQLPFDFDLDSKCPRWEQFITEVTQGDIDHARILQQFAGYCLTSATHHHKALILVGSGRNGKSVFSEILSDLLGARNTSNLSMDQINERFGIAGLYGKKLNVIEEVREDYYDSDILKKIISGGRVSAEVKNQQDKLTFFPTAKHVFCVNTLPRLSDTSEGAFDRLIIVPFNQRFGVDGLPIDPYLTTKLRAELPGILIWAIDGLHDLNANGRFSETEKNRELIMDYKKENSGVREFISEECITGDGITSDRNTLYSEYKMHILNSGGKPKGRQGFVRELRGLGFRVEIFKTVQGTRYYNVVGLDLASSH